MENRSPKKWKKLFFPLWVGYALNFIGSELVQFILIWFLTNETGSITVLATAAFFSLLPRVILAPISETLNDCWNSQRIMLIKDALTICATFILAGLFLFRLTEIWHMYLFFFIRSVCSSFDWPTLQASILQVVPQPYISKVLRMNETLRSAVGVIAPLVAAWLVGILPTYGFLTINGLSGLISITSLFFIKFPQTEKDFEMNGLDLQIWEKMKNGIKFILSWPGLFYLVIISMLINCLIFPGFTFMPLLVTDYFEKGPLTLGMLESAFSLGAIIGGFILGMWGGFKRNIYTILTGIIGFAIGISLIALAPSGQLLLALIGILLVGFMNPIANGPIYAILQNYVEPESRRNIFSILEGLVSAMMPISMVIAVPTARWIGIRGWLVVGAIGCLAIGLLGFINPSLIHIEDGKDVFTLD